MPITHFGSVAVPVDGAAATNATTQITLTPPASMVAGDLVFVAVHQRGTATFSVGVTGGQTWNVLTRRTNTNIAIQCFWAVFDGTWAADPRFDFSAGTCTSAIMHVFRPSAANMGFAIDQAEASTTFAAPTTPFTMTRAGVTNVQASTVTIAGFYTADDNTFGTLAGTGWSQAGMAAQYRNTAGTDQAAGFAYRIQTAAGATGSVSLNQTALGGDAGLTTIVSFYEFQRLTAPLFTNSDTEYAPTVTADAVSLTAPLFTNSDTEYAPTVSLGSSPATWTKRPSINMGGSTVGFWEWLPAGYSGASNLPVIISLHGLGVTGDGSSTQLDWLLGEGLPFYINNGGSPQFPYNCVVICPQYSGTIMSLLTLNDIVEYVTANYNVSANKIHLSGYSGGANSVIDFCSNSSFVAKIASFSFMCIAYGYTQSIADILRAQNKPTVFIHGTIDSNQFSPYSNSVNWTNGLNTAPPINPLSVLYSATGYDHDVWTDTYNGTFLVDGTRNVYNWHFQYTKTSNQNLVAPLFTNTDSEFAPTVTGGATGGWQLIGSGLPVTGTVRPSLCALSSTRVVVHNDGTDTIKVYDHNGTNWVEFASINVTSFSGQVAALDSSNFAFVDANNKQLRKYVVGAGTITQVGSSFALSATVGNPSIAGMGANRVAFCDQNDKALICYDFNTGSGTWSQTGSSLAAVGGFACELDALTSTRIVLVESDNGLIKIYDFSGSTWSLFTSTSASFNNMSVAKLTSSRFAFIHDGGFGVLRVYDLVGTSINDANINFNTVGTSGGSLYPALAGMSSTRVAWMDSTVDELRMYDFGGSSSSNLTAPLLTNTDIEYTPVVTGGVQAAYSSGVVQSGLVLALDSANPASYSGSGTQWNTLNGGTFPATLTAGVTYDSADKRSLVFGTGATGSIDPAQFTGIPVGNANRTISAYVKLNNLATQFQWIFAYGNTSSNYNAFFMGSNFDTGFAGAIADGPNDSAYWTGNTGQWVLMTAVHENGFMSLYRNGSLIVSGYAITLSTTNSAILIGRQLDPWGSEVWNGKIRAIHVYNRALTQTEIQQNLAYLSAEPTFVPTFNNSNNFFGATVTQPAGSQNLTAPLFTNTDAEYAPTVTRGAVTLTAPLFTNTDVEYTPTVTRGAVTLTSPLLTNVNTFPAPVVSTGPVSLTAPLLTNTNSFFAPTVTRGAVTLTASLLTNVNSFFAHLVTTGSAGLAVPLFTNTNSTFAPIVSAGAVSLSTSFISDGDSFFAPSVTRGAVTLSTQLLINSNSVFTPSVVAGPTTLNAPVVINGNTLFSPVVSAGNASLIVPLVLNISSVFTATVTTSVVPLTAPLVVNNSTLFPPSIAGSGSISMPFIASQGAVYLPLVYRDGGLKKIFKVKIIA